MCKKLMLLISFVMFFALFSATSVQAVDPNAPIMIWREAESADVLTVPMEIYTDDPCASGGQYIGVPPGNNSTTASPAPAGTASYIFQVTKAGTYKVAVRLRSTTDTITNDSAWVRISGATINSDSSTLVGGWIKWNNISSYINGTKWAWVQVFNNNDGDKKTTFTMDPNIYTLEIAYREEGVYLDGILITNDPNMNVSTLPAVLPACAETNMLINGGFEDGFGAPWVFDNANPPYAIVGGAQDGYNALKVTIAAPGSQQYIPALAQPGLTFQAGKKYTFSVFLKGSADGMQVYLKPQRRGGSYTGYGAQYKTITTSWAEYSVTTPVFTSDVTPADVSIWLGMQAGEVFIDHVRFYEGDYVLPCPPKKVAVVTATRPEPADGATGLKRQVMLSWEPGVTAGAHNVYLGMNKQEVSDATEDKPLGVLVGQDQNDAFFNFTSGDYGKTYYWKVDEINATEGKIYPGTVWSFSTKPIGLILPQASITATASSEKDATQGAINTINGSGLNALNQHSTDSKAMWLTSTLSEPNKAWIRYDFDQLYKMPRMLIWNYNVSGLSGGFAIKGVNIEYSADGGQTWTLLSDVNELPIGPGKNTYEPIIVDLGGVANGITANSIRITAQSNWSSKGMLKAYGLSEVKFYYLPVWPTNPNPANDANNIAVKPKLTWTPGEGSVQHKVYFGTDEMAVINGTASSTTVDVNNWTTPELILGYTYFWRVEEVNMAATPSVWSGETWSFTVQNYTLFDDFESYSATSIASTWKPLSGTLATSALETSIVHGGGKSLKFMFDDTSSKSNRSELDRSYGYWGGWNWKTGSPQWLVFWMYGDLANPTTEKLYVKIGSTSYYFSTWSIISRSNITTPSWTQVAVPLQKDTTNLGSVSTLGIGVYRDDTTRTTGFIYIDDIRLYNTLPTQ